VFETIDPPIVRVYQLSNFHDDLVGNGYYVQRDNQNQRGNVWEVDFNGKTFFRPFQ